jgi:hypothetical protein
VQAKHSWVFVLHTAQFLPQPTAERAPTDAVGVAVGVSNEIEMHALVAESMKYPFEQELQVPVTGEQPVHWLGIAHAKQVPMAPGLLLYRPAGHGSPSGLDDPAGQ